MIVLDDQTLLGRISQQRDEAALHELYTRYRARLRGYLWLQLDGDELQVEDVLQETFLTIWRAASSFRGAGAPAAWNFHIARREASHVRRALKRRPEGHLVGELDASVQVGDGVDTQIPTLEDAILARLDLDAALARLAPKHREVLDLVFVQGFAPSEVARILGIPPGTVKSRLSYARHALARGLRALPEESPCDT